MFRNLFFSFIMVLRNIVIESLEAIQMSWKTKFLHAHVIYPCYKCILTVSLWLIYWYRA